MVWGTFSHIAQGCKGLPGWFRALFSSLPVWQRGGGLKLFGQCHIEPTHLKKGLPLVILIFLVPAELTNWTSWGACSKTCGPGATRTRSRVFTPGRHGGKTTPDGDLEEKEDCLKSKEFPTPCPIPAKTSQTWGSWSPCTGSCYPEGSERPVSIRRRECISATFSSNWMFNINIANCTDLAPVTESKLCEIATCIGERGKGWYILEAYVGQVDNIPVASLFPKYYLLLLLF